MKNKRFILVFLVIGTILSCQSEEEILRQQYSFEGMNAYQTNCENCHQKDGKGLKDLYPPVFQTDLFKRMNEKEIIHILKYGQKGSIQVNGKTYDGFMPGNNKLEALDFAEIITYLREKNGIQTIYPLDSARKALGNN
ncbi:c-type cytochrome [Aquirufa sp. ROCK2-A2]